MEAGWRRIMNESRRRAGVSVIIAVIASLIITYISGFFRPLIPYRTIDVLEWGSPFPYLTRIAGASQLPRHVDWTMAFVDFVIWAIIVFLIVFYAWARRGPQKNK